MLGVAEPAEDVDPVIDQTRAVTLGLFASDLQGGELERDPTRARERWIEAATARRDVGLVRIIERLDVETFEASWHALMRAFDWRGRAGMLRWLCERERER